MSEQNVQQRQATRPEPAASRARMAGPGDARLARLAAALNGGTVRQLAPKKKLAQLAPKKKLAQLAPTRKLARLVVQRNGKDEESNLRHFGHGMLGGASGFLASLANIAAPGNASAARTQLGQAGNLLRNPRATSTTLAEGLQPHLGTIDPQRTLARTVGDRVGGAAALMGTTALAGLLLRRPYLASGIGRHLMKMWRTAPILQHPMLQHPRVANFAVTRPLSAVVAAGLGAASFYGSAGTRASDAEENRERHPELHEALRRAQLDQLLAGHLNLAVRRPGQTERR